MFLHVPTLVAAMVVGYLMLTLQLALSQRGVRARPELLRWTWGSWALLLGFAALGARLVVPLGLSLVLGNSLLCLGMALYHQALRLHLIEGPASGWLLRLLWPVPLALWLVLPLAPHWRSVVVSMMFVLFLLPSVLLLWRHGWRAERALRLVAGTLTLTILALLARCVHALRVPADYADLLQPSLGQGLTFLVSFMALLGAGFGFVLAVFERVASQMEAMASHDGLTGCLNRSTTDALLVHALARAARDRSPLAFVLLDLDHFKQVNDRHGHRMGDQVLRGFAQVARQRLRHADALGRTGGEEFGLVLPATDAAGARRLVEDMRHAIEAMRWHDEQGGAVAVTVSAGIAVAEPGDTLSADRLYGLADQALYEAKRNGRNRVELYGDPLRRQGSLLPPEPAAGV